MNKRLLVSTSGIRGIVGSGLNPVLASKYAAAYGTAIKKGKVVVGRDSRISGELYRHAIIASLLSVGIDVVDIGIVPTPTVEIAIVGLKAAGGVCITASHNPSEWNALKFLNKRGEFVDRVFLEKIKRIFAAQKFAFKGHQALGSVSADDSWVEQHVRQTVNLPVINRRAVKRARLRVVVDAINGAGSVALPMLLECLGVKVFRINCQGNGDFVHRPEPVAGNLTMLGAAVKKHRADFGMACDPDADRLALVDETGRAIGEELTLALAVKYILSRRRGRVVVNLSTSRVIEDVASEIGVKTYYTPVGEASVIAGMRKHKAVIGGEGNGGVIYPAFHAGRDALVGAAIIVSLLAESKKSVSDLVGTLPTYYTIKQKAPLPDRFERKVRKMEKAAVKSFEGLQIDRRDGLRFDFSRGWFQVRKSNTEPVYRLIVETDSQKLSRLIINEIAAQLK
ncbi:MAG: phosphoglucosamine mutase [Candidatus Zixiibacteriota bacterium]|nr:MAG: phosphoglucosamine mutase [candidate division Zixibacteria bacterium]